MRNQHLWDAYIEDLYVSFYSRNYTPEGVISSYKDTLKSLRHYRERLKNPVSQKGGGPLSAVSIAGIKSNIKSYEKQAVYYRRFIKHLAKYNLLPTSKYISGADRAQFVFSLWTMLELPEFGKAVYFANRLMCARYDDRKPATLKDCIRQAEDNGRNYYEENSDRESMFNAMIGSLEKVIRTAKENRDRYIYGGTPWKPKEPKPEPKQEEKKPVDYDRTAAMLDRVFGYAKQSLEEERAGATSTFAETREIKDKVNQLYNAVVGKDQKPAKREKMSLSVIEGEKVRFKEFDKYLSPEFKAFLARQKNEAPQHGVETDNNGASS